MSAGSCHCQFCFWPINERASHAGVEMIESAAIQRRWEETSTGAGFLLKGVILMGEKRL
jgi:hypothetical protein